MLPWSTYTGTKPETADTAKEYLQRISLSPTRRDFRFPGYTTPRNSDRATSVCFSEQANGTFGLSSRVTVPNPPIFPQEHLWQTTQSNAADQSCQPDQIPTVPAKRQDA